MTTKLDKPVTRETCLRFQKRAVSVTLSPATPTDVEKGQPPMPERIIFHLKGTQQRVWIPLEELFLQARNRGRTL